MKRFPSTAALVAVVLLAAGPTAAHDVPNHVTVQAFVTPEQTKLRLLVRVPLRALPDVDFPRRENGYLDLARADASLTQAVNVWIVRNITVYEGDSSLAVSEIVATRVSLPSDKSFGSYDDGIVHVTGERLADATNLYWEHGLLDALLEYPIRSRHSQFSIKPAFGRLGLRVVTVLRFLPPDGGVRAFEFVGDPGIVRLDPRWHQAAMTFVRLGFVHILRGTDHLLFLLCLVIPFRRVRPLVLVVTSFTVAHSITLISAASGVLQEPLWFPPLVETAIAASIVYMAIENIVTAGSVARRWIIAFAFGLVHGFGFSFALQETLQFAGSHLTVSLLAFNAGVEIGQLLVLAIMVPALNLLLSFVMPERMGTIILSAFVAHTGWHWLIDRGDRLRQFPWSAPDRATLASAMRWAIAVLVTAGLVWLVRNAGPRLRARIRV
jgi:HupE / UreJ protein